MRRIKYYPLRIIIAFTLIILFLAGICGGNSAYTYAALSSGRYDETDVMDDLDGAVINGEEFNAAKYTYDSDGRPSVLFFSEYCYSFYSDKSSAFSLYVYVYNPQARVKQLIDSENNKVQFTFNDDIDYSKYSITIVDYSDDSTNAGLFYKFKVYLSDEMRSRILNDSTGERRYKLSGIELTQRDGDGAESLEEFTVASTYTYTGYAKGYGMDENAESTLACSVEGFEEYLSLDVGYTSYVTDGLENNRDMLMSVYFAVPYNYIEKYGELYAVKAMWLKAISSWGAVIGYEAAYNALLPYVNTILTSDSYPQYTLITDCTRVAHSVSDVSTRYGYVGDIVYNEFPIAEYDSWDFCDDFTPEYNSAFNRLDYLYASSFTEENSADDYTVSPEQILNTLKEYTALHPEEEKVGGKYAASMFSQVDEDYTVAELTTDKEDDFSLEKVVVNDNFWERLFGNSTVIDSDTYNGIKAVQRIYATDFSENDSDIGNICNRLYIGENDYTTIKEYVTSYTADNDGDGNPDNAVYLFRFDKAKYYSAEASICYPAAGGGLLGYNTFKRDSTNAYLFQTPVYINFDIIQLTFRDKETRTTVIPVVMSPIDIVGTAYPPSVTTDDGCDGISWSTILMLVGLVVLLIILAPILPYIIQFIVWVISLPFKAIAAIVKAIQKAAKSKPKGSDIQKSLPAAKPKGNNKSK